MPCRVRQQLYILLFLTLYCSGRLGRQNNQPDKHVPTAPKCLMDFGKLVIHGLISFRKLSKKTGWIRIPVAKHNHATSLLNSWSRVRKGYTPVGTTYINQAEVKINSFICNPSKWNGSYSHATIIWIGFRKTEIQSTITFMDMNWITRRRIWIILYSHDLLDLSGKYAKFKRLLSKEGWRK